jgi:hypothetical protein
LPISAKFRIASRGRGGGGGTTTTNFAGDDGVLALVIQPDGKIVAAGSRFARTRLRRPRDSGRAEQVVAHSTATKNAFCDRPFGR